MGEDWLYRLCPFPILGSAMLRECDIVKDQRKRQRGSENVVGWSHIRSSSMYHFPVHYYILRADSVFSAQQLAALFLCSVSHLIAMNLLIWDTCLLCARTFLSFCQGSWKIWFSPLFFFLAPTLPQFPFIFSAPDSGPLNVVLTQILSDRRDIHISAKWASALSQQGYRAYSCNPVNNTGINQFTTSNSKQRKAVLLVFWSCHFAPLIT